MSHSQNSPVKIAPRLAVVDAPRLAVVVPIMGASAYFFCGLSILISVKKKGCMRVRRFYAVTTRAIEINQSDSLRRNAHDALTESEPAMVRAHGILDVMKVTSSPD